MKKILLVTVLFAVISCSQEGYKSSKLKDQKDSSSYAIGADIARTFKRTGIEVNSEALYKGFYEYSSDTTKVKRTIKEDEIAKILEKFQQKLIAEKQAQSQKDGEKNLKAGKEFLEKNKSVAGVQVTASGLQYQVIKMGNGPKPTSNDKVKVHYTGSTIDGTIFDSSVQRGEPVVFPLTGVIPGWTEGLKLMPVGSKFKLFIPSELAYGERGAGDVIKPNSTLIFDVELIAIEK